MPCSIDRIPARTAALMPSAAWAWAMTQRPAAAAEETALGRRVVVKLLPPDLVAGLSAERFRREIQLAAQLRHPHLVPLLAAGEANGWCTTRCRTSRGSRSA